MPQKKTSTNPGLVSLQDQVVNALTGWLVNDEEYKLLGKLLQGLKPEDAAAMEKTMEESAGPALPLKATMENYVEWYMAEKQRRAEFVESIPAHSPEMKAIKKELADAVRAAGKPLTGKDVLRICHDEHSFAEYLASLTLEQLAMLEQTMRDETIDLKPEVRDALIHLVRMVKEERFAFEQERALTLNPLIQGMAKAIAIRDKIVQLESIQKHYSPPSS